MSNHHSPSVPTSQASESQHSPRPALARLTATLSRSIDMLGELAVSAGAKRDRCVVWALLYLVGTPIAAPDIASAAGVGGAGVQACLEELQRLGAVQCAWDGRWFARPWHPSANLAGWFGPTGAASAACVARMIDVCTAVADDGEAPAGTAVRLTELVAALTAMRPIQAGKPLYRWLDRFKRADATGSAWSIG